MRIALTASVILFGIAANAAYLVPWNPNADGARVGMSANGGGVLVRRVSDTFTYDLVGNLLSASNSVAFETFAYDLRDRLTNAVTRIGTNAWASAWLRDAGGLATNVTYSAGKAVSRTYDLVGRLVAVRDWLGHEWTFAYDAANRPTGGVSPDGRQHTFSYDAAARLSAWSVSGIAGRMIERDAAGRRTRDTVTAGPMPTAVLRRNAQNTFDAADRLVAASAAYNGSRNPVAETFLYDGNGAMTNATSGSEAVFAATYDAQGRLASVGCASLGGVLSSDAFSYDALGNRVVAGDSLFIPDHSDPLKRPLIECDADGVPLRYYIWGPGRLFGFVAADGTLTVAHSDEQGNVIALTDETGGLLYRANYSPHGEDWGAWGTNATPFAWLGGCGVMRVNTPAATSSQFSIFNSQLYLTRHRLYAPVLRRFLSADPLGIDGGLNLYAYANGNPLAYVDPLGLCAMGGSVPGFFEMIGGVVDDFAAGFVAGDFADGAGWGGTAGQIVGGLIPVYGQLADARDTAANVRNVWNDPTSGEAWMGLAMSGVAWIPGVGDAAKGTYKGGRRAVSEVGESTLSEVKSGQKVYRVWGGASKPHGHSWTPVNPSTVSAYRSSAGLPNVNNGRFVSEATVKDVTGIQVRRALPYDGNTGGLPEYLIPNPNSQLKLIRVSGVNPEF